MPRLKIDLREGFARDEVIISVDGREVFRNDAVSTRVQIGLAASVETSVGGRATVEVALPKRGLSQTIEVEVPAPRFLGLTITRDGRLTHELSDQPFRYL
jgi:hypothetical protein